MSRSDPTAGIAAEVPIFLRKTYVMIETAPAEIAGWTDEGETFVIKDPVKFERTIIPQFFKHSKFSSFVRQLNFYSFRKIKYADTIRIDPKLEAETANYWKFRHEHFRQGRPELLTEIKRTNGKTQEKKEDSKVGPEKKAESEVEVLKKRIEEMNKNIDQLTAMVQKVSLKQDEQEEVGAKRKKVETDILYQQEIEEPQPDVSMSGMDLEEMVLEPVPDPFPLVSPEPVLSLPSPVRMERDISDQTRSTDNEFVETLFTAFNDESDDFLQIGAAVLREDEANPNGPDPELMHRLGDALMLLPREIQEMIVDKLIAAIMNTTVTEKAAVKTLEKATEEAREVTYPPSMPSPTAEEDDVDEIPDEKQPEAALPLAAATLAALLHHYSAQLSGKKPKTVQQKAIPVVPVHA